MHPRRASLRRRHSLPRVSAPATPPTYDCADPDALAAFYSAVLGAPVENDDAEDDWVQLTATGGAALAFQRVADYRPPEWPGAEHPQQLHLDLEVDDLDAGRRRKWSSREHVRHRSYGITAARRRPRRRSLDEAPPDRRRQNLDR